MEKWAARHFSCANMRCLTRGSVEVLWEERKDAPQPSGGRNRLGGLRGLVFEPTYKLKERTLEEEGLFMIEGREGIISEVNCGGGGSKWILITTRRHLRA